MATDFTALIQKTRPVRMRRAAQVIIPREWELETQLTARRYVARPRWWQHEDVRQFVGSFLVFFTGAMIFLM
jgi:hypothetical protein